MSTVALGQGVGVAVVVSRCRRRLVVVTLLTPDACRGSPGCDRLQRTGVRAVARARVTGVVIRCTGCAVVVVCDAGTVKVHRNVAVITLTWRIPCLPCVVAVTHLTLTVVSVRISLVLCVGTAYGWHTVTVTAHARYCLRVKVVRYAALVIPNEGAVVGTVTVRRAATARRTVVVGNIKCRRYRSAVNVVSCCSIRRTSAPVTGGTSAVLTGCGCTVGRNRSMAVNHASGTRTTIVGRSLINTDAVRRVLTVTDRTVSS